MKHFSLSELVSSFKLMELTDKKKGNFSRQVLIDLEGIEVKTEKKPLIAGDGLKLFGREEG